MLIYLIQVPVTHICVSKLGHRSLIEYIVACSMWSHYLNQCWLIVKWSLRNEGQENLTKNDQDFNRIILNVS